MCDDLNIKKDKSALLWKNSFSSVYSIHFIVKHWRILYHLTHEASVYTYIKCKKAISDEAYQSRQNDGG